MGRLGGRDSLELEVDVPRQQETSGVLGQEVGARCDHVYILAFSSYVPRGDLVCLAIL